MTEAGYQVFAPTPESVAWAEAALHVAEAILADEALKAQWLRHGKTWFVGVDVLPNDAIGAVDGVPLRGAWQDHAPAGFALHPAQISAMYPGYPQQDPEETDGNHRFRRNRHAAHVDGLLPIGEKRRRYLKEPHAFILGLPLTDIEASPLMVWPGSHLVMGRALIEAIGNAPPDQVDLTDAYQAARRVVFETIEPVALQAPKGGAFLLHRHLLHGVAPWTGAETAPRIHAYFRPQFDDSREWLS